MFARAFWFPALVLLAAAALLLTGCASPSLSPVYSDDRSNVVENNQIVGVWGAKDDDAKYEVLAGAEKSYVLKYTAKDKSSEFDLVLTTIGNQTIADVSPDIVVYQWYNNDVELSKSARPVSQRAWRGWRPSISP